MSSVTVSPLVSLNVHEALTFEGTEICLHPDLFSSATVRHNISITNKLSLAASTQSSGTGSTDSQTKNPKPLQAGDMVELRVWDQRVLAGTSPRRAESILHKRSVTLPAQSLVVSAQSSFSSLEKTASNMQESKEADQTTSSFPRQNSLQYSETSQGMALPATALASTKDTDVESETSATHGRQNSEVSTPHASPGEKMSSGSPSDTPPTKTIVTSGELPPVFPRSRTSTADGAMTGPRTALTKPPIVQRKMSAPAADSGAARPNPKHNRVFSDVTVDTVYECTENRASEVLLESGNQLVDLQVPLGLVDCDKDSGGDGFDEMLKTHVLRLSFVLKVSEKSLTSLKENARTQVSLLRQVADLYELSSYDMVTVNRINEVEEDAVLTAVSADFVLVTIKEQFVSRGEMHLFQRNLIGSWIYEGQRLHDPVRGIQSHAREIRHQDQRARSGIVTEDTKITFRSRSSRIFWLVQMSVEMWDYASPYGPVASDQESCCEIYFDRFIKFAHQLFEKWKMVEATHSLTVVFFSRTFIPPGSAIHSSAGRAEAAPRKDVYGRHYEDHYNVVVEDETTADWDSLLVRLKEAFLKYPSDMGWSMPIGEDARLPSSAKQGNLLEAVNVTLNLLQYHYLDRDLHRTGNSILVVSAGSGVFEVDRGLSAITYQRMMDNGIGSDMLSLSLPPLHIAPFFLYVNNYQKPVTIHDGEVYHEVPHWMHLSFSSYESDSVVLGDVDIVVTESESNASPFTDLNIGPNGFLFPKKKTDLDASPKIESPLLGAFTAQGNAAASPVKRQTVSQERQLIAGRDFEDILEACRPRRSGAIPSPLKSLIYLRRPKHTDGDETVESDILMKEWECQKRKDNVGGTSRLAQRTIPASFSSLKKTEGLPQLHTIPSSELEDVPADDTGDGNSVGSSANSLFSSHLGVSYDRPLLANQQFSPFLTGMQIQRTSSLEVDNPEDAGSQCDSDDSVSGRKGNDSLKDRLRKMMRKSDARSCKPREVKSTLSDPTLNASESAHASSTVHNAVGTPGGIGAALSKYGSGGGGPPADNDCGIPLGLLSRTNSQALLLGQSPNFRPRIHDIANRGISAGLSPLLLPPVATATGVPPEALNAGNFNTRQSNLEHRLVHPTDKSGTLSDEILSRFRRSASSTSQLSRSQTRNKSRDRMFSVSPPTNQTQSVIRAVVEKPSRRSRRRETAPKHNKNNRRKARVFNPFRQEEEEEVLAKKSHNRRRWSHVFPLGEIEFKRHAGPNWKSLSSPAILPMSIDYLPPQHEILRDFQFGIYNVALSDFEMSNYGSTMELIDEMIRQRLTQDYQLVPPSHVNVSNYRAESLRAEFPAREGLPTNEHKDTVRYFLSMGHRLQVLTYDTSSDTVEVTRYNAKESQANNREDSYKYFFYSFNAESNTYTKVVQTFSKYSTLYNWNKLDRIVCGNPDREMEESMRARRVMFGIIPDDFSKDEAKEQEYVAKFQRLVEYLGKLRRIGESSDQPLNISIISSKSSETTPASQTSVHVGVERDSMRRFYIELKRRKQDPMEWIEIAMDSTFNTSWTYRIMIIWLVASSAKVDTQIQLIQRRCSQYGLYLIPFPQVSVSPDLFLNPYRAPAICCASDSDREIKIEEALVKIGFIYDGKFATRARDVVECIRSEHNFRFRRRAVGHQFLHRNGTLFVRVVRDTNGLAMLVAFSNYRFIGRDSKLNAAFTAAFTTFRQCIDSLPERSMPTGEG